MDEEDADFGEDVIIVTALCHHIQLVLKLHYHSTLSIIGGSKACWKGNSVINNLVAH